MYISSGLLIALAVFPTATSQQPPSDWQPDIANWGNFPAVPHEIWKHVSPTAEQDRTAVTSDALTNDIGPDRLYQHAENLQAIADSTADRNRVMGSLGFNFSALYIQKVLEPLADYYDFTWQRVTAGLPVYDTTLLWSPFLSSTPKKRRGSGAHCMVWSPPGHVRAPIVTVKNSGCAAADFPAKVRGKIVLLQAGNCFYWEQAVHAGAAGAIGLIIYFNKNGEFGSMASFLQPNRPEGHYPPTLTLSQNEGTRLARAIYLRSLIGREVMGDLKVEGSTERVVTWNLIVQTKTGDPDNVLVLGAHVDSVLEGPGINDNGSGVAALLETAIQLAKYKVTNAVRFTFWSAHEYFLVGSRYYVHTLAPDELRKIRLYLNFDIIASPNYILGIVVGRPSRRLHKESPPGSFQAHAVLSQYIGVTLGKYWLGLHLDENSDFMPFVANGIPTAGLTTGAIEGKTMLEAQLFGGRAGQSCDPNYHRPTDTVDKLNMEPFLINGRTMAHAVAVFGTSFDALAKDVDVPAKAWNSDNFWPKAGEVKLKTPVSSAHRD